MQMILWVRTWRKGLEIDDGTALGSHASRGIPDSSSHSAEGSGL